MRGRGRATGGTRRERMGGGALLNTWDTARAISAGKPSLRHPPQGEPSLGAQFFLEFTSPAYTFSRHEGLRVVTRRNFIQATWADCS